MWCKNIVDYFLKSSCRADEVLKQDMERVSEKAMRILKRRCNTLSEVLEAAEDADDVEELTSRFDLVNQVMLVFLSDLKVRNRFEVIRHCLKELGVSSRMAGDLERACSLREALEEWKTEIAADVFKKQRVRCREQLLTSVFDKDLISGLVSKSRAQTPSLEHEGMEEHIDKNFNEKFKIQLSSSSIAGAPSLKRPREQMFPLVAMERRLVDGEEVEKVKDKKRRRIKDMESRDDRGKEERHLSVIKYNKTSSRVCYDYQNGKCGRGDKCRYRHSNTD